ncbi:flagellar filament capping protein FliD [Pseudokineococcus sp. 1T1Z-3]|uniref:flagellar filament capping protein FliD n=1 Tax=Pseudokineococcus sp. 1T1Z-3 TaxID=3132745 RepID=UPI0030A33F35
MAGGLSIGGLSSGLDTTTIVSQLMAVESASQTQLKTRVSAAEKQISALQSINTRLSSITSAAAKILPTTFAGTQVAGTAWTATTTSSSSTGVSATAVASSDSRPGSTTFTVQQVAGAHSLATAPVAADATVVPGPPYEVAVEFPSAGTDAVRLLVGGNGTVRDVAAAINASAELGMRATVIQTSPGEYRLQVSATTTGSASQFELTGLADDVPTQVVRPGQDAVVDLGGGFLVASATGSFDDLLPGVSIKVLPGSEQQDVTVSVAQDSSAASTAAKNLVDSVNVALSELRSQSATTPATSSGGKSTAGPLAGDGAVRGTISALLSAVTASGVSPAEAGIELSRDGTLSFDQARFDALVAADPAKAQSLLTGLAERLSGAATAASDPTTGTMTTSITGRRSTVSDLTEQVERWDTRLALRRSTLERQFAALETALSGLQAQSGYLASQISGLPSWSSS